MKDKFKTLIAEVKNSYDIVDYFRGAGFQLQQNGVNKWKTLCPFHKEKTPSFIINESFQNYHCFGCGVSGDLISFVQSYENLDFMGAIRLLAEQKNIEVDILDDDDSPRVDYNSLKKILKVAAKYYAHLFSKLPSNHAAKTEVTLRGLSLDKELTYGYAPNGNKLYTLLKKQGYSDDLIIQSGVCLKSKTGGLYDFFRGRLIFILTDKYGNPVGFTGRKLFEDDKLGKYVNSVDNAIFHKSKVLYNHSIARQTVKDANLIFIVEGQFDVASFIEAGYPHVVASSGTSLTQQHVNEVKKMLHGDGQIVLAFDGDNAGLEAVAKIFKNYPEIHEDTSVIVFPEGEDPCDYRLKHGNEAFREYVQQSVPIVEFMIRKARDKNDKTPVGQSKFLTEASSIVKTVTKKTLRESYIRLLSLESLTDIDTIRGIVAKAKPYEFNDVYPSTPPVIEEERDVNPTHHRFLELVGENTYFNLVARFINLGLRRKSWRAGIVKSRNLIPRELHDFVDELEGLKGKDRIFPELFDNDDLARFFMRDDYSTFDKFMTLEELREHYSYLHHALAHHKENITTEKKQKKIYSMLQQDESNSIAYLEKLLQA